ncbi:MAG TPA: adenosine kinase [Sphingomicrobium sp.]|jgi:sugar/nucleoside kinase (ribokinase family)|nr:adenosine kinase [Sphingomicrobium sp.]
MNPSGLDIVAIGDAIVDVIATCDDAFLEARGFEKGSMRIVSEVEARDLYGAIGAAREISGGSAANSMAGAAALGLRTAFIGQIANDQLGAIFAHDMRSLGVQFETPAIEGPPPTGVCLILVTPDAQRTMSTSPGASYELTSSALDSELIRSASVTFLEGYLWGPQKSRAAMLEAARIARGGERTIAFTLSESLCIGGRREGVIGMIEDGLVDILFGNEREMRALTGCDALLQCIEALSPKVGTLIITRGADGAIGVDGSERCDVPAFPVAKVIDTTGAGDLFAAGFLAGRLGGRSLKGCLEAGTIAAAEVISHFGARPEADLSQLVII